MNVPPVHSTKAVGGPVNAPLAEPPPASRVAVPAESSTTPLLLKLLDLWLSRASSHIRMGWWVAAGGRFQ